MSVTIKVSSRNGADLYSFTSSINLHFTPVSPRLLSLSYQEFAFFLDQSVATHC